MTASRNLPPLHARVLLLYLSGTTRSQSPVVAFQYQRQVVAYASGMQHGRRLRKGMSRSSATVVSMHNNPLGPCFQENGVHLVTYACRVTNPPCVAFFRAARNGSEASPH